MSSETRIRYAIREILSLAGMGVLDSAWLEAVSAHRQQPRLFLAEGVFMYFEESQVKSLVLTLCDRYSPRR